ncbi:DNA polymerase IV, partial [Bacteroidales bacterium OttesenSCG-928-A17]|nr:DNA polymerase IV [Bacteroidales bacterium OttesenSCG-928-A17]
AGHTYYQNARAIDLREVEPNQIRKSIGAENTYLTDIGNKTELWKKLKDVAEEVWRRTSKRNFYGRTLTLKIKYSDFRQITRSKTLNHFIDEYSLFLQLAEELMNTIECDLRNQIRLVGLSISNHMEVEHPPEYQLNIEF